MRDNIHNIYNIMDVYLMQSNIKNISADFIGSFFYNNLLNNINKSDNINYLTGKKSNAQSLFNKMFNEAVAKEMALSPNDSLTKEMTKQIEKIINIKEANNLV